MLKTQLFLTLAAVAALLASPLQTHAQDANRGGKPQWHMGLLSYPEEAKSKNIEGTVVVEVHLDGVGEVREAIAIGGPEVLSAAALKCILNSRYSFYHGEPQAFEVTFNYKMPGGVSFSMPSFIAPARLQSIQFEGVSNSEMEMVLTKIGAKEGESISLLKRQQITRASVHAHPVARYSERGGCAVLDDAIGLKMN